MEIKKCWLSCIFWTQLPCWVRTYRILASGGNSIFKYIFIFFIWTNRFAWYIFVRFVKDSTHRNIVFFLFSSWELDGARKHLPSLCGSSTWKLFWLTQSTASFLLSAALPEVGSLTNAAHAVWPLAYSSKNMAWSSTGCSPLAKLSSQIMPTTVISQICPFYALRS